MGFLGASFEITKISIVGALRRDTVFCRLEEGMYQQDSGRTSSWRSLSDWWRTNPVGTGSFNFLGHALRDASKPASLGSLVPPTYVLSNKPAWAIIR